ncbi:hypothetical protein [Peribacillus simplex]|nr:hypothetical protein [Peribacillus simplex]
MDFTFHEIGEKPKDVPLTEFYNAFVMNGYYVQTQVKFGSYQLTFDKPFI